MTKNKEVFLSVERELPAQHGDQAVGNSPAPAKKYGQEVDINTDKR